MYTLGVDAYTSREVRTGVEWYTYHLLRAMQPLNPPEWRVFLYTLKWNSEPPNYSEYPHWQSKRLQWPPKRGWGQIRLSWEMMRRPPNVLFVPGAPLPAIHPHAPWRKRLTVTTIHDVGFLTNPDLYAPADRRRQLLALDFAMRHAAHLFVPSEATRIALVREFGDRTPITVTPLGVDHARYRPLEYSGVAPVLEKYQITEPYLLFVGRIDAKKNLPTLICAFSKLTTKNYQLILAGTGGFEAEKVRQIIQEMNVGGRVRLLGYVPEDDLPALFCGAQAFVFPSAVEGFGLPVLEALACGVPTIASDISALREVAGDCGTRFVHPNDVDGWTSAMQQILEDETIRASLRDRGFARARDFSWERCGELTWQTIQNLV